MQSRVRGGRREGQALAAWDHCSTGGEERGGQASAVWHAYNLQRVAEASPTTITPPNVPEAMDIGLCDPHQIDSSEGVSNERHSPHATNPGDVGHGCGRQR